jgi:hypothetical protein
MRIGCLLGAVENDYVQVFVNRKSGSASYTLKKNSKTFTRTENSLLGFFWEIIFIHEQQKKIFHQKRRLCNK